jgi:beta-glucosidase
MVCCRRAQAFYPGTRGAEAIALSLFGVENRFGRMPYTVYDKEWVNRTKMTEHDLTADEGRTYRYYPQSAGTTPPIFEFGAGLSLTTFNTSVSPLACSFPTEYQLNTDAALVPPCTLTATTTNIGSDLSGDIVLALYLKLDDVPSQSSSKLKKQLVDFIRLEDIRPGQTKHASFEVMPETLALSDVSSGNLVAAAGSYTLTVEDGSSTSSVPPPSVAVKMTGADAVLSVFPA